MKSGTSDIKTPPNDAKKVFWKKGTCSRTFFYLLDRDFGHLKTTEEKAADPLAGGIMQEGHQCGMLWGASLALGAEAFRRFDNLDQAMSVAISGTQKLMKSFSERTNTVNCRTFTQCDFSSTLSFAKYFFSGKYKDCFTLAEDWAPKAIQTAKDALSDEKLALSQQCINCASEVAKKMGATEEEMVMVAGFAGGLGLTGNGCGALSAAIWMNSLAWCKEKNKKSSFNNPRAKKTLKAFKVATNSQILCENISGKRFKSIADHTHYIKKGGCAELIDVLANS